jgi:hypothetical protein
MAKSFVSPGVVTQEIDASFLGPGVGSIGAALIGKAAKGPAFVPITVSTYSDFVEWFGDLDENEDNVLGYAARAYLRNAATANIVRVLGPSGRTVNGSAVNPGYSAESIWAITAHSGSGVGAIMALLEVTGNSGIRVTDLTNDLLFISGTGTNAGIFGVGVTASFITGSSNYIKKVLNTDPTKFTEKGYYVRDVYDYAAKKFAAVNANFNSASYGGMTNFQMGYNSGSSPWIKSQAFGGTEYNLFRVHTIGHGEAENGRFKVSVTNVRPSAAPSVTEFGQFDLEVRMFADTDKSRSLVEVWPNLSLNDSDPNYILKVIGDKFLTYDNSQEKMVEFGNYANSSKFIRVELATGSFPDAALPWGFRGLDKPDLVVSASIGNDNANLGSGIAALPYVADLKDKETQGEAQTNIYWGMETVLSGSVKARLTRMPTMTGSDSDFSLKFVSGAQLSDLRYDTTLPVGSQKSPTDTLSHTGLTSDFAKFTVPLAFGFDGFDRRLTDPLANESQLAGVSQLGTQALRQAIDVVADPDFIDINLLAIPGIYSSKIVDYGITKVEDRSDAFYVIDISGSTVTAVVNEVKGRGFDTNYAGVYYPSIRVKDDVNGGIKTLPASVAAIGAIAFNDRVAYPWFAPAGLNRAGLSRDTMGFEVSGIGAEGQGAPNQKDRDTLYQNRINPITRFPEVPQGVIWGQKTLQLRSSALDRINVRRLMLKTRKLISAATKFLVFEQGNAATMTRFKQLVNPILADIQQKQGLEAFKVLMDERTSPPELIDRNQLKGKVFLIPTKSAEIITVDFVISPSGATFEE